MKFTTTISIVSLVTATVFASDALVARQDKKDDPCALYCDTWFGIPKAEDACHFLVNDRATTYSLCAGCSIHNGATTDGWASAYYGDKDDSDYNYNSDCKACYEIDVPQINFGSVREFYLRTTNQWNETKLVNSTSTTKNSTNSTGISSISTSTKIFGAAANVPTSSEVSTTAGQAEAQEEDDNKSSDATKLSASILVIVIAFIGASI